MPIELSVIVAAQHNPPSLAECLRALVSQVEGRAVEVIIAADRELPAEIAQAHPDLRVVQQGGALTPVLWKLGYDASSGARVAFTIAQCVPSEGWVQTILSRLDGDHAGVGGPILSPDARGSLRDWSLYLARYSAFMPSGTAGTIQEIAGDNAAYRRSALEAASESMRAGFWETLTHHAMRQHGESLCWEPSMTVRLASSDPLGVIARLRFRHGRHYASTRPGNTTITRLLRFLSAPLLIPVLLNRIRSRVQRQHPEWMPKFWRVLPMLTVIAASWSLGEALGYLMPRSQP